ncbi:MAG: flagellar motor protein MotB [Bryobacteraceae bacterium]
MSANELTGAGAAVDALLRQATLARAARLARAGRYADAELLLVSRRDAVALDLLARIRVQQHRLAEAQGLWLEASRLDPRNGSYQSALERLAGLGKASPTRFWLRWLAAAVLLLVLAGMLGLWLRLPRHDVPAAPPKPSQASVGDPAPMNLKLGIPGIAETASGRETVLRFDSGLFKQRAVLTPAAERLLQELGNRLEPYARSIAVEVLGYCDDLPVTRTTRYADNRALAVARADAVVRYLTAHSNLPASIFSLQAGAGNPFPNDNTVSRERNRTVALRVIRVGNRSLTVAAR